MKIKFDSKTIEISKTFADKASHFGSMEYHELLIAMRDLPDYCTTQLYHCQHFYEIVPSALRG